MNDKELMKKIETFRGLGMQIKDNIRIMAEIYKSVVDTGDNVKIEKFINANKNIPMPVFDTMLEIARGKIFVDILWTKFSANRMLRSLPVETQKTLCREGAEILVGEGADFMKVRLDNMTDDQFAQLIDKNGYIRNLQRQKVYLENKKNKEKISHSAKATYIDGKRLFVTRPTVITLAKLKSIISEMEK